MESITETRLKSYAGALPFVAVAGGIIAIASLFLYWVDINTVFSYSFFEIPYEMKATAIKVVEGNTDIPDDWHNYCPAIGGIFALAGAAVGIFAVAKKSTDVMTYAGILVCGILAMTFSFVFASWNLDVPYVVTLEDQANITNLSYVLQASLGDSDAVALIRNAAVQAAIDSGSSFEVANAITSDYAVGEAIAEIQAAFGLDLTDPAVKTALSSANPADFTAGNELTVGYLEVKDVLASGFYVSVVGGVLVTVAGAVGLLASHRI